MDRLVLHGGGRVLVPEQLESDGFLVAFTDEAVRLGLLGHQDTDPTLQDTPIHQAMTLQGVEIKEEEVRGGEWGTGRCSFKAGEGRLVALPAPHMLGPRSP